MCVRELTSLILMNFVHVTNLPLLIFFLDETLCTLYHIKERKDQKVIGSSVSQLQKKNTTECL